MQYSNKKRCSYRHALFDSISLLATCAPLLRPSLLGLGPLQMSASSKALRMNRLQPNILFKKTQGTICKAEVVSFSDAAFNVTPSQQYRQTGVLSGVRYRRKEGDATVYHRIDWTSLRQRRVSSPSYGAEILACTEADDRGYRFKMGFKSLSPLDSFRHILNVDSKGLFDTLTTLHEGREFRLRQTVQRIRDSFESRDLNVIRLIQGRVNIADVLTKRNPDSHALELRCKQWNPSATTTKIVCI